MTRSPLDERSSTGRGRSQAELESGSADDTDESIYGHDDDEGAEIDGKAAGIIIAAIAGGYLLVRGAKWAKPRVERWWNETAQPKLVVTKEKLAAKFKKAADSRQEETTSGSPEAEEIEDKGEKDAGEKV